MRKNQFAKVIGRGYLYLGLGVGLIGFASLGGQAQAGPVDIVSNPYYTTTSAGTVSSVPIVYPSGTSAPTATPVYTSTSVVNNPYYASSPTVHPSPTATTCVSGHPCLIMATPATSICAACVSKTIVKKVVQATPTPTPTPIPTVTVTPKPTVTPTPIVVVTTLIVYTQAPVLPKTGPAGSLVGLGTYLLAGLTGFGLYRNLRTLKDKNTLRRAWRNVRVE